MKKKSFAVKKEHGMTIEEAKEMIEELKEQGETEEDIVAGFYAMFCEGDIDVNELSDLIKLLGYELTDEFKNMSEEDQKTKGWAEDELGKNTKSHNDQKRENTELELPFDIALKYANEYIQNREDLKGCYIDSYYEFGTYYTFFTSRKVGTKILKGEKVINVGKFECREIIGLIEHIFNDSKFDPDKVVYLHDNVNIKEISINTNHIFMRFDPENTYKDRLRISKNWISYKRDYLCNEEKENDRWDYKTNSKEFKRKYNLLCYQIEKIRPAEFFKTDVGNFEISILYSDGTCQKYQYDGNFYDNKLDEIARLISKMVPNNAPTSGLMKALNSPYIPDYILEECINKLSDRQEVEKVTCYYPRWIINIFDYVPPIEYMDIATKLLNRRIDISLFDMTEVHAMLLYFIRGEHWDSGSMLEYIKNGYLLKVLIRYKELTGNK